MNALRSEALSKDWKKKTVILGSFFSVCGFLLGVITSLEAGLAVGEATTNGLMFAVGLPLVVALTVGMLLLYFVPAILAHRRAHQHEPAIFLTNLFLGLTIVGWLLALIWASTAPVTVMATDQNVVRQGAFCARCGACIRAGDAFCGRCGQGLS